MPQANASTAHGEFLPPPPREYTLRNAVGELVGDSPYIEGASEREEVGPVEGLFVGVVVGLSVGSLVEPGLPVTLTDRVCPPLYVKTTYRNAIQQKLIQ